VFAAPGVQTQDDGTVTSSPATLSVSNTVAIDSTATVSPSLTSPSSSESTGCEPISYGYGPRPLVDSPGGFRNDTVFSSIARGAPTPLHFVRVYINEHGATQFGRFLQYHELEMYNTNECARHCDQTEGCEAFNIYFERSPTLNLGPDCRKTFSTTMVKCNLWGNRLNASDERTVPYSIWDFEVVVAASNAYNRDDSGLKSSALWIDASVVLASASVASALVLLIIL
jgi:hypothetical protein